MRGKCDSVKSSAQILENEMVHIEDLQRRHAMTSSTDVRHIGGIFLRRAGHFNGKNG
jgi:hypothetical protein